ncbi:hypothetical protein EOM82_07805 [bacterium]|nr:hypothetical protein [bacterium]
MDKIVASYQPMVDKLFAEAKTAQERVDAVNFFKNEYIEKNPEIMDLASIFFDEGTVNQNNRLYVEIGHGGTAYMIDPGAEAPRSHAYTEDVSVKLNRFGFLSEVDVNADQSQTIVKLVKDAGEIRYKIFLKKFKYIWDLIAASIVSGSPVYISASSVNKTNLDTVMNTMMDISGNVKAIIGRYSLVTQIMGFSGWSEASLREIEMGTFGQYKGATLVGIKDTTTTVIDGAGNKFSTAHIPANQLILVGEKCGFHGRKAMQSMTQDEARTGQRLQNTFEDYAAIITDAKRIGVYNIA